MTGMTLLAALWLGILASVSPCPLAANMAAFSFIQKDVTTSNRIMLSGILYSAGRMVAFATAGLLVISGILAIPEASIFMQKHMNRIIGPILLIVGVFVLDLLEIRSGKGISRSLTLTGMFRGSGGAFLMGILFAMAMCPVSAALFFGGLVPLAAEAGSKILLPALFGLGSALPVAILSFVFSLGTRAVSKSMGAVYTIQKMVQTVSGIVLLLVGVYFSLTSTFAIF